MRCIKPAQSRCIVSYIQGKPGLVLARYCGRSAGQHDSENEHKRGYAGEPKTLRMFFCGNSAWRGRGRALEAKQKRGAQEWKHQADRYLVYQECKTPLKRSNIQSQLLYCDTFWCSTITEMLSYQQHLDFMLG